jgi:hypothetical protein
MKPVVLSLGAGVQSSTILLLSCKGLLPRIDLAIFADTGWERIATYQHLNWLETEAKAHGIPVIRVSNGDIRNPSTDRLKRFVTMPFYGVNGNEKSMLRRQCTSEFKIVPIRRKIRELFDIPDHNPLGIGVELWLGISTDEEKRVKGYFGVKYAEPNFPLIKILPMSRADCLLWLKQNYPEHIPVKSACVGCPFHDNNEWRDIQRSPDEWKQAVEFDKTIRYKGYNPKIKSTLYLHSKRIPLDEIDLRTEIEKGQLLFPAFEKMWGRQNDFLGVMK